MRARAQIGRWIASAGLMLALAAVPGFVANSWAQDRRNNPPRPSRPERAESRPQPRNQTPRPYQPPTQGHHAGQWLNQHRNEPLEEQRKALESDPQFRRLPPERQQKFEQGLGRFDSMPPQRQEQVLRRMETWEHLTPQQKQQFRSTNEQFRSLPPDRRQ